MISLYTLKVKNLSTTSPYTNWAENHKQTGHFQQKYWKSRKIAHFVTSLWRPWGNVTRFLILIHKNLDNPKKLKERVKSIKGAILL